MLSRDVGGHTTNVSLPPAVPIAVTAAATPSAALPSTAPAPSTAALFGPVTALAVDRAVSPGLKGHCGRLATTRAHYGGARAHASTAARAIAAIVGSMRWRMPTTRAGVLFGLATGFAAPRRGVAAFLEELLFPCGESKFLTAVATGK
jgi:hypothetical protein